MSEPRNDFLRSSASVTVAVHRVSKPEVGWHDGIENILYLWHHQGDGDVGLCLTAPTPEELLAWLDRAATVVRDAIAESDAAERAERAEQPS